MCTVARIVSYHKYLVLFTNFLCRVVVGKLLLVLREIFLTGSSSFPWTGILT